MKKIFVLIATLLILLFPISISSQGNHVVDNTSRLSDYEISQINDFMDDLSNEYDVDILVYFTDDYTDNISLQAADYFESLGYSNGFTFIVNFNISEYDIVIMGDAQILSGYIEEGMDYIYNNLANGDFYSACVSFGNWIDYSYQSYYGYDDQQGQIDDEPVEETSQSDTLFTKLGIAAGGGGIVSVIAMLILNGQLKTEGKKTNATNYAKPGSFKMNRVGDIFLYRNVIRHPRPKMEDRNNNNHHFHGGGSFTTGHSSSGHSFSSSGGHKF